MCNMHFDVPLHHFMSLLLLVRCTAFGGLFKLREIDSSEIKIDINSRLSM